MKGDLMSQPSREHNWCVIRNALGCCMEDMKQAARASDWEERSAYLDSIARHVERYMHQHSLQSATRAAVSPGDTLTLESGKDSQ